MSMLMKLSGMDVLNIKQREWIQEVYFYWSFDKLDFQTNKLQYVHALHCTIVLYIVPQGKELSQLEGSKGRGPDRKVKW